MPNKIMYNNMIRRAIISGGGTGGHIFPAISIANAIKRKYPEAEIRFIGSKGRMEMTRVPEAGYPIVGLPVEGLQRKQLWRNFGVIKNYILSLMQARTLLKDFKPDVVVGVGGYASAPTLKMAQWLGIPTLIQEQNSYAGVSNKYLSRDAQRICVAYPDMQRFFPSEKIVLTGNPIRPEIEFLREDRAAALAYFGFDESPRPLVLVLGGSLGARTINESIAQQLSLWVESGVRLIWQTGKAYDEEAKRLLASYVGEVYQSAFIDKMDYAYQLADLVVSRAGASTISELCHLAKPSILVPSPNVAEDHQTKNAEALSNRGAAILIPDAEAVPSLSARALELVREPQRLTSLSEGAKALAEGSSADRIVAELETLIRPA